jgi:hypothetical protein
MIPKINKKLPKISFCWLDSLKLGVLSFVLVGFLVLVRFAIMRL